ncbi:capsule biosynthesis protein [Paracoccus jiaweipingae]|uniref:capsule biosynthesis protein n=1 Tax=unclassified Paracoccus (in: a-proteobacteria) TaxID=2688777 RepID=UPI0037BB278B
MTTPPKATRFHARRDEAALTQARKAAEQADTAPATAAPADGGAANAPAPSDATASTPAPRQGQARVFLRRSLNRPQDATTPPPASDPQAEAARLMATPATTDDGFGDMRFPGAGDGPEKQTAAAGDAGGSGAEPDDPLNAEIEKVRAENHSQRKLRLARRIAALHQIDAASDEEAVVRLRQRGIDPFHRGVLGKVLSKAGDQSQRAPGQNVPATVTPPQPPARRPAAPPPAPPSGEPLTDQRRAAELIRIQRDIARRRQRRAMMMFTRLAFFVFLPTIIAGWYYFTQATPLYGTESQFQIQTADGAGSSKLGGLMGGLQTNTDAVSVQSYLTSRDAMARLDRDLGFRQAYQDPAIDPLQRLAPDATNEETYKTYEKSVKIGYDPTEGVLNMEVIAPDPALSKQFSLALIRYAEEQVDHLTARLREDQMKGARENYQDAEQKVLDAQARVQGIQEKLGIVDAAAEGGLIMSQVSQLQGELTKKRLELAQLEANARPNASRVAGVRGDIARIEDMLSSLRTQLTEATDGRDSIAAMQGELRIAESDLQTRQGLLAGAAEQMEMARIEANKQVRYLSVSVAPVPPDEPTYPRAFENTLVAFLIFSGIYLMLSLTASILREQVSA